MPRETAGPDFLFALFEVQRLLRLYADKRARQYGLTRAQWAVLAKLQRFEGLKQAELAEMMEMQPITLTRLVDKLCDSGMVERRSDDTDRRIKRLHLTKAARPLMGKLTGLRANVSETALDGLSMPDRHRLVQQLEEIKDNIRDAIQVENAESQKQNLKKVQRYG